MVPQLWSVTGQVDIAGFVVGEIVTGSLVVAAYSTALTSRSSFGGSLGAARSRLGALLTTGLLSLVLSIASLIAFPYFFVRWGLATSSVMLEDTRNWGALDASKELIRGHWTHTIATLAPFILPALFSGALMLCLAIADVDILLLRLLMGVAFTIFMPYSVAVYVLLFFDLKARHGLPLPSSSRGVASP